MLRNLTALRSYVIHAADGELGRVRDFFFDDESWIVRYVVVDTGTWLPGRKVLITPGIIDGIDWEREIIHCVLTKRQIEDSPPVHADAPVSRQIEERLFAYFGWTPYWPPPRENGASAPDASATLIVEAQLRSAKDLAGYGIAALDGDIGHLEDLIAEDKTWAVRYLVVGTRNWLPGRKVLISPEWVSEISWAEQRVHVDLSREAVKESPPYDPSAPVNRQYEMRLYDFYGRPTYWSSSYVHKE
jgi:hypothetical protein